MDKVVILDKELSKKIFTAFKFSSYIHVPKFKLNRVAMWNEELLKLNGRHSRGFFGIEVNCEGIIVGYNVDMIAFNVLLSQLREALKWI